MVSKHGFTGNAGRCIIISATKEHRQLISVVLGCDSKKNRTVDSTRLLNYGFYDYSVIDLAEFLKREVPIIVDKSEKSIYYAKQVTKFLYPLKDDERDKINVEYHILSDLVAPIEKGQCIGTADIQLNGVAIHKIEYCLSESIMRKPWNDFFYKLLEESLENYEIMVEKIVKL